MGKVTITGSRATILKYIYQHWKENTLPPSLQDIADEAGLTRGTVRYHILKLKELGVLEYDEGYKAPNVRIKGTEVRMPKLGSRR